MGSKPATIYRDIKAQRLDLKTGIQFFTSIVEKGQGLEDRLACLEYLKELSKPSQSIFHLLENLLISDLNTNIRAYAARYMMEKYLKNALSPMKWAIQYENNVRTYIVIIKALIKMNSEASKKILMRHLQIILDKKYIIGQRRYDNREFKKSIELRLDGAGLDQLTSKELGDILINHKIISKLVQKYHYVFFKWEKGLISKLDLSELGWNVARSWEFVFEQRIENLSDIPGLTELKQLKRLNLSNNYLTNIKVLTKLDNLTHLTINNNQLEDPKNLYYLLQMDNLGFLSIKGNKIAYLVEKEDFPDTYLVLRDYLVFH